MRLGRPPLHQLSYSRAEAADRRSNVRSRWQFAHTISHLAASSSIRWVPARPIILVTADRLLVGSRWSKSIAHGGKRWLQSAHGRSRSTSSRRAWARHRSRLWPSPTEVPGGDAGRAVCRRHVRIRWQLAHTTSHFDASASSAVRERSMAPPEVSRNAFSVPSRWSKSIWWGSNVEPQSRHGRARSSRRNSTFACWRTRTRAPSWSRFRS
jgi:hypothetical protein